MTTGLHDPRLGEMVPLLSHSPHQWLAASGMILRTEVGSTVHGTNMEGQDDRDEMGIFLEPPRTVLGSHRLEHYTYRTQPEGVCSGPGDLDLVVYTARKFCRLAAKGNATVLLPLWVPEDKILWINEFGRELRANRHWFVSRQAGRAFRGYLHGQRQGLLGIRAGTRNQGRADIRARYGFDCYLDDTEFLTRRGWRTYDEIADEEAVGTVDQLTGRIEFQVPTERVSKPYEGLLYHFHHRYTNCVVTPNHRMWSSPVNRGWNGVNGVAYRPESADWQFRWAAELRGHQHVQVCGTPRETEADVSDADLVLYGCYLSEGTVHKRRQDGSASVLSFTQQVGGRLEPALAAVGATYPLRAYRYERTDGDRSRPCDYKIYTLANRDLANRVDLECGIGSRAKHLPPWAFDLSARQAEVLLGALFAGDGTRYRAGYDIYYTTSQRLAGDVQALAVIAGRRANMWGPYDKGMYQVMIQDPGRQYEDLVIPKNRTVEDVVDQRIVCFTVPNETLVTRRNGRVAMHGNTKFAMHMVRIGIQGVALMRTGEIPCPVPEPDLTWLRELRAGEHTKEEALARAERLENELDRLTTQGWVPEHPDTDAIDRWLESAHRRHWGW